jgi:hypothetical protein
MAVDYEALPEALISWRDLAYRLCVCAEP